MGVSGGRRKRQKIARDLFVEFPGSQIVIFSWFRACPLCECEVTLGRFWAVPGGSRAASDASKLVSGRPGGVPENRVPPPEGRRGLPWSPKWRLGPVVIFTEVPQTLRILMFQRFRKNPCFLSVRVPGRSQEGPGRLPGRASSVRAVSQEGLGQVDKLHGDHFWVCLDRKKPAGTSFLMEILQWF